MTTLRALLRSCRQLWDRDHGIDPVRLHVLLPTVVVPFKALKPGVVPEKPLPPAKRLILENPDFPPVDFERLPP